MDVMNERKLLEALFAVAWSDGRLRDDERRYLSGALDHGEFDIDVVRTARGWLDAPPSDPPDFDALSAKVDVAVAVLREAMRLAAADDTVQFEELQILERLRGALGISQDTFHAIQREVEQEHAAR